MPAKHSFLLIIEKKKREIAKTNAMAAYDLITILSTTNKNKKNKKIFLELEIEMLTIENETARKQMLGHKLFRLTVSKSRRQSLMEFRPT